MTTAVAVQALALPRVVASDNDNDNDNDTPTASAHAQELRASLHQTLADLQQQQQGSVKPSLVAVQQQKQQRAHKAVVPTPTTNTSNNKKQRHPDMQDLVALQSLLAALSFSPTSHNPSTKGSRRRSSTAVTQPRTAKAFTFDSPPNKVLHSSSSSNGMTTPSWVIKRRPATPPTASLEEDEATPSVMITPSPPLDNPADSNTKETPSTVSSSSSTSEDVSLFSPVRSFRHPTSSSSADAVALAYPLSLPLEVMQQSNAGEDSTTTRPTPVVTKHTTKPVKKYPTVDTNIPGAGVRRSSVCQTHRTSSSSSKLPFVHMIHNHHRPLVRHHNNNNNDSPQVAVAQHVYGQAKGAWAWGKQALPPVVTPLLGAAEGLVAWTAGLATGQPGDLQQLDRRVLELFVTALDEQVLHPVLQWVGGMWQGLTGVVVGGGGGQDP